jgi:competence ComEA-like helix-hairpin-helix protein
MAALERIPPSALCTPHAGGVAMAILFALPLLAVLALLPPSWPARAQSQRPPDETAPRVEAGAKAARPPRVVAVPGEARVNINSADVKALMTLSGMGRKVAQRIVAHREAHGPFKKPEDIRKVDGVTETMWEQNRARIAVR